MMPFTTAMTFIPSKGHLANWRVTEGKCKIIYHDSEDSLVSLFLHIITYVLKYTQYMYIIDKEFHLFHISGFKDINKTFERKERGHMKGLLLHVKCVYLCQTNRVILY